MNSLEPHKKVIRCADGRSRVHGRGTLLQYKSIIDRMYPMLSEIRKKSTGGSSSSQRVIQIQSI